MPYTRRRTALEWQYLSELLPHDEKANLNGGVDKRCADLKPLRRRHGVSLPASSMKKPHLSTLRPTTVQGIRCRSRSMDYG